MMPNITRGGRMSGLMVYLAGGGRHNEHQEQHLVAGDSVVLTMYGYDQLDAATALQIAHDLDEPHNRYEVNVTRTAQVTDPETGAVTTARIDANVWHCSLSLRAEEGQLSDEKWGAIAQDFADRMGFTETMGTEPMSTVASGKAACRWVAVRQSWAVDQRQ